MKLLKLVPDNTNIKFLKLRIPFFVLSLVLIFGSWAAVLVNGLNLGVDFVGGQEVRITFEEQDTRRSRACANWSAGWVMAILWCRNSARPTKSPSVLPCPKGLRTPRALRLRLAPR
jgi:SecD/SecF GG Motif